MSQEEFKMKPKTGDTLKEKSIASGEPLPDPQQADQPLAPQESQANDNNPPTSQRDIDDIKTEIQHHWHQAEQSYLEVGKLLIEARTQVKHGEWLQWLKDNTEISPVRAQRLIRLAEEYASDTSPVTHLGFSKASVLLTLPKEEREAFVEETHDVGGTKKNVSDMSKRELEKVVREHKQARSPNKPKERPDSAGNQEFVTTEGEEPTERANSDPVSFLLSKVVHFEHIVDDVLGILTNQVDNAEEQEELVSALRRICDKALRELPPAKPVEEALSV